MKYIPCTIETFRDRGEDYWQISVSAEHAAETALECSALHLGLTEKVVFSDGRTQFLIRPDSVTLGQRTVPIRKTWLDAVWHLFLKAHRNGWTNAAHIDQDFSDINGDLCITVEITLNS